MCWNASFSSMKQFSCWRTTHQIMDGWRMNTIWAWSTKVKSFQGLTDHLSLTIWSCKTVSSLIEDFYNWPQKSGEAEDASADDLQILVCKIVAHKPEFLGVANQCPKHLHNLQDPYFRVVARGQCLVSLDSKSFTQFKGWLAMMFGSCGKHARAVPTTSAAANSKEASQDIVDNHQESLSHKSSRYQHEIDAKAMEIASMKAKLNHSLEENCKLKEMFNPDC